MVSMLLPSCALPHARCRILGLHRHRTNLRSFPRKRESRGRKLGQRTGSPLPRGRTELRGDSNSAHLALEDLCRLRYFLLAAFTGSFTASKVANSTFCSSLPTFSTLRM